jgi:hypothetical protein
VLSSLPIYDQLTVVTSGTLSKTGSGRTNQPFIAAPRVQGQWLSVARTCHSAARSTENHPLPVQRHTQCLHHSTPDRRGRCINHHSALFIPVPPDYDTSAHACTTTKIPVTLKAIMCCHRDHHKQHATTATRSWPSPPPGLCGLQPSGGGQGLLPYKAPLPPHVSN